MQNCIIIGGGLIGMLTARELAAAGASVTVLDKSTLGHESSWAGGGILSPLYPWRYDDAVSRLASISQSKYRQVCNELQEESGVNPEWTKNGLLILDTEEKEQALSWASRFDSTIKILSEKEIHAIEPAIAEPPKEAIWMPDVAQVRNPRLIKALQGSLRGRGVTLKENVEVTRLIQRKNNIEGVKTNQGDMQADIVIVAGGAWSGQLLAELGCPLEIKPVRGQMILYRAEPGVVQKIILQKGRYVIPRRDGRVLVGSTLEDVGFDKSTTDSARAELQSYAQTLVPGLAQYKVEHHWAGLRPGTQEGIPYICEHPGISGLFINTGHFRNGVVLGLASARLLKDLVHGHETGIEMGKYSLSN